jgi:hypothetical protein
VDQTDISIAATIIHCINNTMQFSFRLVAILAAFFLTSPVVTAENQIRVVLNKGVARPDMSCTTADLSLIETYISKLSGGRNLRQGNVETKDGEPDMDKDTTKTHQERKLPFYPTSCKTTCQGFAPTTCLAVTCKGFRRELEAPEENDRDLQSSTWCPVAKFGAENLLNMLSRMSILTTSCSALVQLPRTIDCIYNVVC